MRALRKLYDFITGGSIAAPLGLICGIVAALAFPAARIPALTGFIALGFVGSVFERER